MFDYVFFDLDGTLLNTLDDLANAGNYALAQQGFETHDTERYKYFVGNGIPKLIERILPPDSSERLLEKTHALFAEYYGAHSEDCTRPYDGITELLDALADMKVRTAVITNKDNVFAGELIRKYFGGRIGAVYGSLPGTPHKPDPFWVNRALSDLGADRNEVLYAGDSGVDMQTAKNAGLAGAGVLWGFRDEDELTENGASYICRKPSDILDIVIGSRS
ncbi:MAG: HAD family hydrolase [Ruminiclostridium sp.]|nr:HAD family hydrolase [Ruminiclostridium sp.]